MKRNMRLLGIMVLLGTCVSVSAQTGKTGQEDFDEFRKKAEAEYSSFRNRSWEEYQAFRDSVNKVYADFLEKAWAEFKMSPAIPKPKEREVTPIPIPKEDRDRPFKDRPIKIEEIVPPVLPTPQPVPIAPVPRIEEPTENWVTFTLYGTEMKVRFSEEEHFTLNGLNEKAIADAWRQLSQQAYNNTLRDCLVLRMKHHLSDWAYLRALEQVGKACCEGANEATMLTAFLYCQSGYQMRLGMSRQTLYMLYASDYAMYDQGCYTIGGTRFYILGTDSPSQMFISEHAFPKEQTLSLLVAQEQQFAQDLSEAKTLRSISHPEVSCQMRVNKNLLAFYDDYPSSMVDDNFLTRWAMYANTPLQQDVKQQLYPMLKKYIEGKSELEAVGVILDFVQMAFPYAYDDKEWGYDRAFFAEETLFYIKSDCEDHAILFSRLIRDLVGLKVVLVYYPRHLAAAVQFTENVQGDYLMVNGQKFVISDPTFFGARVGQTMDDMDNSTAKAIQLE